MNKQHGYIVMFLTILFAAIAVAVVVGVVNPVTSSLSAAKSSLYGRSSFIAADSGTEEVMYRLINGKTLGSSLSIGLVQGTTSITVANTASGKRIDALAQVGEYQKNIRINLAYGTGIAFHYGIQAGRGGFELENSSSITGNVFSTGTVVGSGNLIKGDVVSTGSSGLINGIHATGTAYAHTIQDSTVDKDAYYVTKTNTTVGGTSFPGSADQDPVDLPISDEQIAEWETQAAAVVSSGCSSGKYIISANITLGPIKIPCDLEISGSPTITIAGPIWVVGDITIKNSPTIRISSGLGNQNVAIIADNPSNQSGSGKIDVNNTTTFIGSGTTGSFVFMISQNNSAETGGSNVAIELSNNSTSLVGYAAHGLISIANSVSLKEATAYKIHLQNSANVTYDTGLSSTLFSAGPGGGYNITDWTEI